MTNGARLGPREWVEAAAAHALLALPPRAKRRIAGDPIRRDGLELDLDTQVLLRFDRPEDVSSLTVADARANLSAQAVVAGGRPTPIARVEDLSVAGAAGPLRARLYAVADAGEAMVVYFHGGGWVCGDLDTHDATCRVLARTSGARVLSVDYRLAPEHPFPAPVDDVLAAFRDAAARARELGADPDRIAVAGDSAGGHLAAVTAMLAARDGGPAPAFQLLVYPVTDCAVRHTSRDTFADGFYLTKEKMDWYEDHFLAAGGDRRDPRVSPFHADELSGVAPALVLTAGFDPLRDEGEAYAEKLRAAGVPTVLRRHPGYVHGFFNAVGLGPNGREAVAEAGGMLRQALAS